MVDKFIDMGIQNPIFKAISVDQNHANEFICNSVHIGCSILTPSPNISEYCEGYVKYLCDLSEFIKSGGSAKCLTLKL